MRTHLAAAALLLLGSPGCSGSGSPATPSDQLHPSTTPQAVTNLGTAYTHAGWQEAALALYTLDIDPAALTATAALKAVRLGQANDDLYLLSINNFLRPDSFRIAAVRRNGSGLELDYIVTHPFPAPADPTGTPNGFSNRSDLGIAGRVLFLLDAGASGNTYFTDRIANTGTITNADGFYSPEDLISFGGTANTFPFLQLVDEAQDARSGVSNGGNPKGNFGNDGWTRALYGPNNDGWTGYGVLHQGQSAANTVAFDLAALGSGLSLDVAIIAKYNDPRGGQTAAQKRANRLPGPNADPTRFAYRMPHGALDVASIAFMGDNGPGFLDLGISGTELVFHVVDWDAKAAVTSEPPGELQNDLSVTNVEGSEVGSPSVTVCIPGVLGDPTVTAVINEDGVSGEGIPGDPLIYRSTVSKTNASSIGTFTGMVRAVDPEDAAPLPVPLDQGTPPLPLGPGTTPPRPVAYQAFTVDVNSSQAAPTATYTITTPVVPDGGTVSLSVNGLNDDDGDPVDIEVDWDNNGTFTFVQTVNSPYPGVIPLSSPITYTHTPPIPDTRSLPVRITDGIVTTNLLPTQTFNVAPPAGSGGWIYAPATQTTGTENARGVAVSSMGNIYFVGAYATGTNWGGGPMGTAVFPSNCLVALDSNGDYLWHRNLGSVSGTWCDVQGIGADSTGNVMVYGYWRQTIDFGFGPETNNTSASSSNYDTFTCKYGPTGTPIWNARSNGDGISSGILDFQEFNGMSVDQATGDVVITGKFSRTETWGAHSVVASGGPTSTVYQPYVTRISAAGTALWAITYTSASINTECGQSTAFTPSGDVINGGYYRTGSNFGGGVRTADSGGDGYIVRLNGATGAYVWDYVFDGTATTTAEYVNALAADGTRVYATGRYFGGTDFGGGSRTAGGTGSDIYVLALDLATGAYAWDRTFSGTTGSEQGRGIALTTTGILATGDWLNGLDFGTGAQTAAGGSDLYMIKLNPATGATVWLSLMGSTNTDIGRSIAATPDGSPILAGSYTNTIDFDPGPMTVSRTAVGGSDAFVGKYLSATGHMN